MFPALAPTRFIGATLLASIDRARPSPPTIHPAPRPRSAPDAAIVERAVPRLGTLTAIDARRRD